MQIGLRHNSINATPKRQIKQEQLAFGGPTRIFKKQMICRPENITSIISDFYQNNGVIGSLPKSLIQELKKTTKTKEELAQKIKAIYKAFQDGIKDLPKAEKTINKALKELGIKKNKVKFEKNWFFKLKMIGSGKFGNVYKFKIGKEEYALKIFKESISAEALLSQVGNFIEQAKAAFLKNHKVNTFTHIFESSEKKRCVYFEYGKMLWGDINGKYMVSNFEKNKPFKTTEIYNQKTGKLELKALKDMCLSIICRDININNIRKNTIIDYGVVSPNNFSYTNMTKQRIKENTELIKSVFKTSTPDEFLENFISKQEKLVDLLIDYTPHSSNTYAVYSLIKAFEHASEKQREMFLENAQKVVAKSFCDNFYKMSEKNKIVETLKELSKNPIFRNYLIRNEKIILHVKEKDKLELLTILANHATTEEKQAIAFYISAVSPEDRIKLFRLLNNGSDDSLKRSLSINLNTIPNKDIMEAVKELFKSKSEDVHRGIIETSYKLNDKIMPQVVEFMENSPFDYIKTLVANEKRKPYYLNALSA